MSLHGAILVACPITRFSFKSFGPLAYSTLNLAARSNFTDCKKNLGCSYANPYPSKAAAEAGYQPTNHANAGLVLAADLNAGVVGKSSRNHEGRGQNVLFADYHVQYLTKQNVG